MVRVKVSSPVDYAYIFPEPEFVAKNSEGEIMMGWKIRVNLTLWLSMPKRFNPSIVIKISEQESDYITDIYSQPEIYKTLILLGFSGNIASILSNEISKLLIEKRTEAFLPTLDTPIEQHEFLVDAWNEAYLDKRKNYRVKTRDIQDFLDFDILEKITIPGFSIRPDEDAFIVMLRSGDGGEDEQMAILKGDRKGPKTVIFKDPNPRLARYFLPWNLAERGGIYSSIENAIKGGVYYLPDIMAEKLKSGYDLDFNNDKDGYAL